MVATGGLWPACHDGRLTAPDTRGSGGQGGQGGSVGPAGMGGGTAGGASGTPAGDAGANGTAGGPGPGGTGGVGGRVVGAGEATGGSSASGGGGGGRPGGRGSAGGTPGTSAIGGSSGGLLVTCPSGPPSGACTVDGLSCAYPTGSCLCDGGTWRCLACPQARPENASGFSLDGELYDARLFFGCSYGNITCSSPSGFFSGEFMSTAWACGACPATRPTAGNACGNTTFECQYGDETCRCSSQTWSCTTPACADDPVGDTLRAPNYGCDGTPSHYTCRYPAFDQNCVCGGMLGRRCACPSSLPLDGSACLGQVRGSCQYGEVTCGCTNGRWGCAVNPPPVCPAAQPTPGVGCTGQLSCAYGNTFCSCDGTTWSCS